MESVPRAKDVWKSALDPVAEGSLARPRIRLGHKNLAPGVYPFDLTGAPGLTHIC